MEQGSILGHGSYLAPDWIAEWLHRNTKILLSQKLQIYMPDLTQTQNITLQKASLKKEVRTNSYDSVTGTIIVSDIRAGVIEQVKKLFCYGL